MKSSGDLMDDNGAGERTLRGGPWAWCLSCSFPSGAPVTVRYSVWRKRWECGKCKRPVEIYRCEKCGFEGGDATQLPAPKRPWGFQIMIKDGLKKTCPRCGDISVYPVKGERPSGDGKGGASLGLERAGDHPTTNTAPTLPEGQSPAAEPESVTGAPGEPATPDMENPGALKHTPSAETAGDIKDLKDEISKIPGLKVMTWEEATTRISIPKKQEESQSQKPSPSEE